MADPSQGQKVLEEGVVFASADILNDLRATSEQSLGDSMAASAGDGRHPLFFYPDGSSTTLHLVLQDPKGRRMAIQLRGITGEARIVELPSAGG